MPTFIRIGRVCKRMKENISAYFILDVYTGVSFNVKLNRSWDEYKFRRHKGAHDWSQSAAVSFWKRQSRTKFETECAQWWRTGDLHGDGDRGNPVEPAGIPRGWKDILRDSRGNVAAFDYNYGASASTKCIHCPLLSYAKRWVLNYNDNANWNISFG